jgi:hypothetical protein
MKRLLTIFVFVLAGLAQAQTFDGTVSVQAVASSFTGSDVSRTAYPVGFPYIFKQGDLAATSALNLTGMGVSAAQYKITSRWPDNSIKSIWGDALVNYTAGGPSNQLHLSLTGGSGNFGGSDLAVNNSRISGSACQAEGTTSGYICVNTGAALFEIRKADYAGPTKVVVGSTTLVDDAVRASDGLVVMGPPAPNDTNAVPPAPASAPTVSGATTCTAGSAGCPTASRTYYVKVAYVSASGESLPSPVSASTVVTAAHLLQVTCPDGAGVTPTPTGCYIYVGSASANTSLHLQQPTTKPLALGATWTEPLGCQITLRDDSTVSLPQARCQGTGGVLNYTQSPQFYAVAGNSGCLIGSCNTPYKSSLDDASTALVEENGPVKALIKAGGSYASSKKSCPTSADVYTAGTGNETVGCYGRYTERLYFYKGQTSLRRETIDRNADFTPSSSANQTHQASDYKGRQSLEIRTALADVSAKSYSFKANRSNTDCGSQLCTGSLTLDAFLYQAYHPYMERYEMNGNVYDEYSPPLLALGRNTSIAGTTRTTYAQEGYEIVANGSLVTSAGPANSSTDPGGEVNNMGWADIKNGSGAGVQVGIWNMAAAYPGQLKFKRIAANTYDAVIGLQPDQTEPLPTTATNSITSRPYIDPQAAVPYYAVWPQYEIRETFWNFHDAALAAPDAAFQGYQQFLLGRPALADFNRAEFFTELYPLIDPATFDGYIKNTIAGSMSTWSAPVPQNDLGIQIWVRGWDWRQSGEGNQNEYGFSELAKWLQRGGDFAVSYLKAKMLYRYFGTQALPRADFSGGWRGTCPSSECTALDQDGFPSTPAGGSAGAGKYPVGNYRYKIRNHDNDDAHQHFNGMTYFALLSGDPTLMDAVNQAYADIGANENVTKVRKCPSPGPCYSQLRNIGNQLALASWGYTFYKSQGNDADAAKALSKATGVFTNQLPQTANGYGFGSQKWGQSPVLGLLWEGARDDGTTNGGDSHCPEDTQGNCGSVTSVDGVAGTRIENSFFTNIAVQAVLDSAERFGPAWTHYQKALDLAYGATASYFGEGGWVEHNQTTGCITSIMQNIPACSTSTAGAGCYPGNPCSGHTYWLQMEFYNSDKLFFLGHNTPNSAYFNFLVPILLTGNKDISYLDPVDQNVSVRNAFHEYLQLRGPNQGIEDGSMEWGSVIGALLDPPLTKFTWQNLNGTPSGGHWIDVQFTNSGCSGQTYCTKTGASPGNLTWTAPASVVAYRMKMNPDAKQIVDLVRLDNVTNPHADGSGCLSRATATTESGGGTGIKPSDVTPQASPYPDGKWYYGCWLDNPNLKWPWFSSGEVTISGTPTSFNPTTAPGYNSAGQNTFALRAYVTSSVPTAYLTGLSPIIQGNSSTLQWTTSNVTSAAIDQGIGSVALNGSTVVSPSATTTYTLTATGPSGSAQSSFTVVVTAPPPVPTADISVNPQTITAGNSATLSWATTDATSISIAPGIGSVGASGTWVVTPAATTTYIITATGPGGTAQAQTTLTVNPVIPPGGTTTVLKGATTKGAKVQ